MPTVDDSSTVSMPLPSPVEITFVIRGGPPTAIDGIASTLERVLCRATTYRLQRRLGDVVCPAHNERPRVIASGPSADNLTFTVVGCCQVLVETATAKLG